MINNEEKRNASDIKKIFIKLEQILVSQIRGEEHQKATNKHLENLNGTVAKHEKEILNIENTHFVNNKINKKLNKIKWFTFDKIISISTTILIAWLIYMLKF